jgi:HEAT repeat protein
VGIERLARAMLNRRGLRERLLAVCALGQMRDNWSWDRLLELVRGSHLALSLAAARALVQINAKAAIPLLLPLMASREDWSPSVVVHMLQEAGADDVSGPLVKAALEVPPEQAHRLVRYFGVAHSQAAVPAVRQLIRRTTDVECLVACLRVFSDAGDLETVRRYLTHPTWEVRVQAVIALGRMGTPEDEASLVLLLSDPEWWVRYRAAHALHELPPADATRFDRIALRLDDRFARDMLVHVHAERRAA